jgi:hypothetical protein
MYRGPKRHFGSKQPSVANAIASMKTMLVTAKSIETMTVEDLMRRFRVDRKTAEYELTIAKQRRAG